MYHRYTGGSQNLSYLLGLESDFGLVADTDPPPYTIFMVFWSPVPIVLKVEIVFHSLFVFSPLSGDYRNRNDGMEWNGMDRIRIGIGIGSGSDR